MKDSKNNSFILLDEDEKKRIRMIYSYTQNKEKYKEAISPQFLEQISKKIN